MLQKALVSNILFSLSYLVNVISVFQFFHCKRCGHDRDKRVRFRSLLADGDYILFSRVSSGT